MNCPPVRKRTEVAFAFAPILVPPNKPVRTAYRITVSPIEKGAYTIHTENPAPRILRNVESDLTQALLGVKDVLLADVNMSNVSILKRDDGVIEFTYLTGEECWTNMLWLLQHGGRIFPRDLIEYAGFHADVGQTVAAVFGFAKFRDVSKTLAARLIDACLSLGILGKECECVYGAENIFVDFIYLKPQRRDVSPLNGYKEICITTNRISHLTHFSVELVGDDAVRMFSGFHSVQSVFDFLRHTIDKEAGNFVSNIAHSMNIEFDDLYPKFILTSVEGTRIRLTVKNISPSKVVELSSEQRLKALNISKEFSETETFLGECNNTSVSYVLAPRMKFGIFK